MKGDDGKDEAPQPPVLCFFLLGYFFRRIANAITWDTKLPTLPTGVGGGVMHEGARERADGRCPTTRECSNERVLGSEMAEAYRVTAMRVSSGEGGGGETFFALKVLLNRIISNDIVMHDTAVCFVGFLFLVLRSCRLRGRGELHCVGSGGNLVLESCPGVFGFASFN